MGRYVGTAEANMRKSAEPAEDVQPSVLWVDEMEKAFAGIGRSGSGSEITTRLFGYFLTWMQEKTRPVFVLATANDVTDLPPELLRKGRFDDIFSVELPKEAERAAILKVHLEKRKKYDAGIDIEELAHETEGFSGADLEGVVKDAVERTFVEGRVALTTERLLCSVKNTVPLAVTMKDKIDEYAGKRREMRIKSAS